LSHSIDVDSPVACTFARCFVRKALRRLQDKNSGTLAGEALGNWPRDRAADLFVAVQQENDLAVKQGGIAEHFDGGKRHGDADLHVQRSGSPEAAVGHAARHTAQRSNRPHGVQVAKQQNWLPAVAAARSKARFKYVAIAALAMQLDAPTKGTNGFGCDRGTCVDGSFCIAGRFHPNEPAREIEQCRLFAAGSGEQGAHGHLDILA
jgi:hypothetical protein